MKKLLLFCFILTLAAPVTGQITDFNFLYFREEQGLTDNQIYDFQEDLQGRIWIATQTGVSCFDGKNFKNYIHPLADSEIWKDGVGCHFLTLDCQGRIWEATTRQLFYFDEKKDQFTEFDLSGVEPESSKKSWKSQIYLQDWKEERSIWFRKGAGIYAINCDDLVCRRKLTIPPEYRSIWGVLGKDLDGNIAVNDRHSDAITFFRPDGSRFNTSNAPADKTMIFHQPGTNQIWVGGKDFMSYDKNTGRWEKWSIGSTGVKNFAGIMTIPALTGDSILWIYSAYQTTVVCFNTRQNRFVAAFQTDHFDESGLRCGLMRAMFVDSKNNIWLGGNAGISALFSSHEQFERYAALCPKGTTQGQISMKKSPELYVGGTWKMPDGSLAQWVADGEKLYYIALSGHSKAYFEGKRNSDGITGQCKFIDLQTGQRTLKQLNYRKNKQGVWLESNSSPTLNLIERPLIYWPATKDKVMIPKGEKFEPEKDMTGSWSHAAYFFQDGDSILFVHPFHIFHGRKIKPDLVQGVQVRWWGGCRTEMEIDFRIITPDSLAVFFKMLDSNCDYKKGETGTVGIKRLRWQSGKDSIFIHTFRVFDKIQPAEPIDFQEKPFELEYAQNFISFEFDCANPAYPTLWYKLEGFDHDWFKTRSNKQAGYTNLNGGDYIFRVKATDENGHEMGQTAWFRLHVKSPYYRTWWFYILCLTSVGGLFYALFRYREIQRLRQEHLRLRIARDLHDEVGSTLSSISILSASALRGVEKDLDNARFGNIGEKARAALDSISDIVWSVNPENDSMEKALARMSAYAAEMLENVGAELHFEVGAGVESLSLPMEKRKDFYLIFKEAIHNCAKYARAQQVEVAIKREDNTLILSIKDDGIGFEMGDAKPGVRNLGGNGLRNMQSRAAAMGGRLEVSSSLGSGTTVQLQVKLI